MLALPHSFPTFSFSILSFFKYVSTLTNLEDDLQSFLKFLCSSVIVLKNGVQPRNPNLEVDHKEGFFNLNWKTTFRLTKNKSKEKAYKRIVFKCEGRAIKTQKLKSKIKACGRLMFKSEIKACKG